MQKQSNMLLSCVLETTPESARKLLYCEGRIIRQYGNAIILSSCTKISNFTIAWSRKKNDKCHWNFPIIMNNNKASYLNILTREITNFAHPIKCNILPPITFIRSTNNEYYSLDKTGHFLREKTLSLKLIYSKKRTSRKASKLILPSLWTHKYIEPAF